MSLQTARCGICLSLHTDMRETQLKFVTLLGVLFLPAQGTVSKSASSTWSQPSVSRLTLPFLPECRADVCANSSLCLFWIRQTSRSEFRGVLVSLPSYSFLRWNSAAQRIWINELFFPISAQPPSREISRRKSSSSSFQTQKVRHAFVYK